MAEFCPLTDNITNECGDDFPLAGLGFLYIAPVRQVDLTATVFDAATHDITAIALKNTGKFVKIEGKVSTKDLATENAKDGGGNVFNLTANALIPNLKTTKSFLLEEFGKQRLVVIAELFEKDDVSGNRKAVVIGLDNKMLTDAGAIFAFNNTVEAEQGGVNGYNCVITATQGESTRFMKGDITVEDGATGETVSLG